MILFSEIIRKSPRLLPGGKITTDKKTAPGTF
jgi:hypothetical protein